MNKGKTVSWEGERRLMKRVGSDVERVEIYVNIVTSMRVSKTKKKCYKNYYTVKWIKVPHLENYSQSKRRK